MSLFRRANRVPGARQGGLAGQADLAHMTDLADLTDPEAVDALLLELDELRATVYRQDGRLREEGARLGRACAAARVDEHRRALVAVEAMTALAAVDPGQSADVRAFAARIHAALGRIAPGPH